MNLNSLFVNFLKTGFQLINYQTVRWRAPKKPFWLGVAKSKKFIVPQPRIIRTDEEKAQNEILKTNHRTELNALLNFIRNTNPMLPDALSETNEKISYNPLLEAEISRSLENNAIWNAESARRRDERMKKKREKVEEAALLKMEIQEEKKRKKIALLEEVVRKEKLLSASFITPENIDQVLENCLNNVQNYDFAIDLEGNRYPGSEPLRPQLNKEEEKQTKSTTV